ncbi:MAG: MFS transporter [Alphaproteobacteria bacterium]|nr:MFS transporter [Alphaproteobacteria bacterium]
MSDTNHGRTGQDGWRQVLRQGHGGRILVVTGGVALHAVSIYVVATIMPVVVAEIGGVAFFAWTSTLYIAGSLTGAAAVPLTLAQAGPRRAFSLAFAMFMLGSLLCSLAPSMGVLLAGRLVQGLGGGMLPALAYATIRSVFPPALHAWAISILGSVWGVAALLGPSVGGVFAQFDAWRAAFWVDLAIGLAFAAVAQRVLPRAIENAPGATPVFPALRLGLIFAAAIAVSAGGITGRPGPAILGLVVAIALVAAMLRLDARAPVRLFLGGAFVPTTAPGAVTATMALLILAMSPCTFVAYILRAGHDVAPITGGYVSALISLAWTAASLLTASARGRRARRAILAGPAAMAVGIALDAHGLATGSLPVVIAGQILVGTGIGLGWAHLGALLMEVAPAAERNIAGPFITTAQTLAAAFGTAIAGMVANTAGLATATTPAGIAAAAQWLFGALLVFPLAGCLTAWRVLSLTAPADAGKSTGPDRPA